MRFHPWAFAAIGALAHALPARAQQDAPPAVAPASGAPSVTGRAFTPKDWYRVTTVGAPAVSPDGAQIAFTVTTVREAENARHSEVWLVAARGGAPRRLTSPGTESSAPRFSADGKLLFFTSNRPGGRGNTWAIRLDEPGEAFQPTGIPTRGSAPRDGRFLVWAEGDSAAPDSAGRGSDPFGRMQAMARPPFGAITQPIDPARFDGRHVTEMRYKANGQGFLPGPRTARRWRPAQIWMQNTDGSGKRALTATRYSHREPTVSPDGRWVAFTADARLRPDSVVDAERDSLARLPYDARRDEAERNDIDVYLIPMQGGTPRKLVGWSGAEGSLTWSPDSRRLLFVGAPGRMKTDRLYVVDVPAEGSASAPRELLGSWAYGPQRPIWLENGDVMFTASIGGRAAVMKLNPATRALVEVVGGRRLVSAMATDPAGRTVAFVGSSVARPAELFVVDAQGAGERQLTTFNDALNREIAWADAERITYRSVGGREIEGWLMKPHGYQEGRKYPLVLYIHGGPHSQYHEGWFDETQNLAGAGMWVLYTNPRGSSGYGGEFTYSTRARWGMEDYQDLMKAVDLAVQRPGVDAARLGVTGGSYGGFMTAWITTKTQRFKAAQADRMISNWWSWYGVSDAQGLTEFEFLGKPWDNPRLYDELSPIRYAHKVRTPTLIVQSEEDHRTPMADAEQWFLALKKHGVPVEFVRYPRSNHDLSRTGEPWLLVDRLGRLRQWFGHWLGEEGAKTAAR